MATAKKTRNFLPGTREKTFHTNEVYPNSTGVRTAGVDIQQKPGSGLKTSQLDNLPQLLVVVLGANNMDLHLLQKHLRGVFLIEVSCLRKIFEPAEMFVPTQRRRPAQLAPSLALKNLPQRPVLKTKLCSRTGRA
jgi:hypothetical protein